MSTGGIGAFISGVFDGIDYRHDKEDRKRRQGREDVRDAQRADRHKWDSENQDWRREDADDARTERTRRRGEEAEDRQFWDDIADGYPDGSEAPEPQSRMPADAGVMPPEQSTMDAGLAELSDMSRHPAAAGVGRVAVPVQSAPVTAQSVPTAQDPRPATEIRPSMEETNGPHMPDVLPPARAQQGVGGTVSQSNGRISADAEAVGAPPKLILRAAGADRLSEVLRSNTNPDTYETLSADDRIQIAASIRTVEEEIIAHGSQPQGGPVAPLPPHDIAAQAQPNAPVSRSPAQAGVIQHGLSDLSRLSRPQPMPLSSQPAPAPTPVSSEPASTTPLNGRTPSVGLAAGETEQQPQAAGPSAEVTREGTPTPSVDSATLTAPMKMGASGQPDRPTPAQSRRATKDFRDHYMAQSAPKIIKHYLSRGEIDKAREFQEFIDSKGAKAGMAAWAKAAHAAAVGDERGFIDGIEDAYNETGYYDDGYTMLKGKSGLVRDDAGKVTGAQIVFKDEQTGKEFTQEFNSTEDLYGLGLKMLSPEEVFEQGYAQVQAAKDFRRKMEIKLAATQVPGAQRRIFMDVGEYLNKTDLNFANLTADEQFVRIQGFINQSQGGAATQGLSAQPPVLR